MRIVNLIRNRYGKVCAIVYPEGNRFVAFMKNSKMPMSTELTAMKWIGVKCTGERLEEKDLKDIPDEIREAVLKKTSF